MNKKIRILIITILTILIIAGILIYLKIKNRKVKTEIPITEVQIIDKNNNMQILYDNPEKEEYVLVDIKIDGTLYKDVGIRTKGSGVYEYLDRMGWDNYSFKVKFNYKDKEQKYNRNDRNIFKYRSI